MEGEALAFLWAFLPCSFEGFEMSMSSYLATVKDKRMGNLGTIIEVIAVLSLIYLTYMILPILISDTSEYFMKMTLG